MDINEQERIDAVNHYIRGDKPSDIYRAINRSEKWLFKWVNRFKTGEKEWFKSKSRAPKQHAKKTDEEIERVVVNLRKALMDSTDHESKYLGVGADAIQYRMVKLGFSEDEMPSVSTIKRIVKKHGLKVNKRERYKRVKSKKRYTILNPTQIDEMHQMDFVGPRFIKGSGSIYSLNLIDVVCNRVQIEQYTSKKMSNVIEFLIRYWNNNPIPRYLQVDNGMYFIGDFTNPRKFSRFVRLCLYVGVEVVFIAPGSPWMNGSIESFNNWFGSKFWDKETFTDLKDMRTKSTHFVCKYNDLSVWKKRNKELKQTTPIRKLKNSAEINQDKLPLTDGKIHFIRQVDNNGTINVLNEVFKVGEEFISEYVWATIYMGKQRMEVYYRAQDQDVAVLIKEFDYDINEEIKLIRQDIWKS
jgi:transposase InsO family protein/transposase-like protein